MKTRHLQFWAACMPVVWLSMIIIGGCQSLGLQQPQGIKDRIGYSYGTYTAIIEAATIARQAGSITREDAQQVLTLTDQAKALLDGATAAYTAGDAAGADNKLALAAGILSQVQTYLRSRK